MTNAPTCHLLVLRTGLHQGVAFRVVTTCGSKDRRTWGLTIPFCDGALVYGAARHFRQRHTPEIFSRFNRGLI